MALKVVKLSKKEGNLGLKKKPTKTKAEKKLVKEGKLKKKAKSIKAIKNWLD
jgi:hypothetical protein